MTSKLTHIERQGGRPATKKILPDGTIEYYYPGNGRKRYKPVPLKDRKYAKRKPDDPRAIQWNGDWYLPLELLADDVRRMPETRPDEDSVWHALLCECDVCKREVITWWKQMAREIVPKGVVTPEDPVSAGRVLRSVVRCPPQTPERLVRHHPRVAERSARSSRGLEP